MQWCGSILCRYKLCSGVAAYYVKSVKRTLVKIRSFLYTLAKKLHCIEIIRTYIYWCVCSV